MTGGRWWGSIANNEVKTKTKCKLGPPVGVEEDVNEGGGDGWQCFRVQCEDTEAVLRALDGMHCRVGTYGEEPGGGG